MRMASLWVPSWPGVAFCDLPACWLGEAMGTVSLQGEPGLPEEEGAWSGERRATRGQQGSPLLGGSVSWVEGQGKSITAALEGCFSKAPREPGQRPCKGVKSRAQDPQEKGSGAPDRRFLQTPQDTEPVTPWTGQEAASAERREGGPFPWGWEARHLLNREARPSLPKPPGKLLPGVCTFLTSAPWTSPPCTPDSTSVLTPL